MICQDPYRNVRNFGHAKYGRQGSFVGHNGGDGTWDTLGLYVFCGQKKLGLGVCKEITWREVMLPLGLNSWQKSPMVFSHMFPSFRNQRPRPLGRTSASAPPSFSERFGQAESWQGSGATKKGWTSGDLAIRFAVHVDVWPGDLWNTGKYWGYLPKNKWFSLDFWTCPEKRERVSTRICETFSWAVFLKLLLLKLLLLPLQVPLRLSLLRHRMVAGCWLMLNLCCDSKSSWCFSLTLVGDQQLTAIHLNFSWGKRCACKKDLGRSSLCPSCDELCLVQLRLLCIDACRSGPYIAIHCLRT